MKDLVRLLPEVARHLGEENFPHAHIVLEAAAELERQAALIEALRNDALDYVREVQTVLLSKAANLLAFDLSKHEALLGLLTPDARATLAKLDCRDDA